MSQSKIFILTLSILLNLGTFSFGQCQITNKVFKSGEKFQYTGYYNWGFIWLNAGHITFGARDTTYNDKAVIKIFAKGGSNEGYDWIFKIRENFVTLCDINTLKPLYSERSAIEGDYWAKNVYRFDYTKGIVNSYFKNKEKGENIKITKIEPCTFDYMTAVYYARSIDYSKIKPEEKIPIKIIDEGEYFNLFVRYKGIEKVYVKDLDKEIECIKATILLIEGTVFNEGENMTIWVTNDQNRVPVVIEAKILVGSVKAIINKVEGLKYPSKSL